MDLEGTIVQINDLVWKHTKQVEQNKKRFHAESIALIERVGQLSAQCEKAEHFVAEMETRLEQLASTETPSEVLLYQMLESAQTNLESTQHALEDARERLESLKADHDAVDKLHARFSAQIQRYCEENASQVAQWQDLLGCKFSLRHGYFEVNFDEGTCVLLKHDYGYKIHYGLETIDYDYDGNLPRLLLKMRSLRVLT